MDQRGCAGSMPAVNMSSAACWRYGAREAAETLAVCQPAGVADCKLERHASSDAVQPGPWAREGGDRAGGGERGLLRLP